MILLKRKSNNLYFKWKIIKILRCLGTSRFMILLPKGAFKPSLNFMSSNCSFCRVFLNYITELFRARSLVHRSSQRQSCLSSRLSLSNNLMVQLPETTVLSYSHISLAFSRPSPPIFGNSADRAGPYFKRNLI